MQFLHTLPIFDLCSLDKNIFAAELITEIDQIVMNQIHSYLITVEIATCLWFFTTSIRATTRALELLAELLQCRHYMSSK